MEPREISMEASARDTYTYQSQGCPYCGAYWHQGMCPRIESIEYHPNGTVKSVKLREP